MAFTDRFIELPIKVFNQKEQELIGTSEYFDSLVKINPFEISEYRSSSDTDLGIEDITHLAMKNGHTFNVYMTVTEFENRLNNHNAV